MSIESGVCTDGGAWQMTHDERVTRDMTWRAEENRAVRFLLHFMTVTRVPRSATPNENLLAFAATVRVTEKGAFHDV